MADTSSTFPTSLDSFPDLVGRRVTPQPIASEPFTVPSASPYDYVLVEVPQESTLSVAGTPPGGAGSYTLQTSPPTASGEVQINWKTGRLTFHSSDAGGNASAAYTGLGSALTVERILKVYNAALAIEQTMGSQYLPTGFATLKAYLDSEVNILRASATDPVSQGFTISGGICFVTRHTPIVTTTQNIDLTTGTYQFPSTTATYWRRGLFTIDTSGTVNVYWSDEAATQGALVTPVRPLDEFAVCAVDCEDAGTGGTPGDCNDIDPADITDLRQQLNLTWDAEGDGFYAQQSPVADDQVSLFGGTFYHRNASGLITEVIVNSTTMGFGAGDTYETTAITANYWNALVITVDSSGTIKMYEGTSNAAKGSVVLPDIPKYDELPISLIYFQDDGSGTAGSILPIDQVDIINLYVSRLVVAADTSAVPDLTLGDDIDDYRVEAQTTPDKTVYVNPGRWLGRVGDANTYAWVGGNIDFGSAGTHQKTITGTNYMPVILTTDFFQTSIYSYDGTEAAAPGSTSYPRIPDREIPLAIIMLQGDGTGVAGGIEVVEDSDITDLRGPLRSWKWKWHQDGLTVRRNTIADGKVIIEEGTTFFDSGKYYSITADVQFDIAGGLTEALTASYYKWVLLSIDSDGNVVMTEPSGGGGATVDGAPMPPLEFVGKNRPLAYVIIQDAGSGLLGDITNIVDTDIFPPYQWAQNRFHTEDWFAVAANTTYNITHDLDRMPKSIQILWQSTGSGGVDSASDIALVAGPVFLNTGASVIEITPTTLKIRTDTYVAGFRNASGVLQQPTTGYYKVCVQ